MGRVGEGWPGEEGGLWEGEGRKGRRGCQERWVSEAAAVGKRMWKETSLGFCAVQVPLCATPERSGNTDPPCFAKLVWAFLHFGGM